MLEMEKYPNTKILLNVFIRNYEKIIVKYIHQQAIKIIKVKNYQTLLLIGIIRIL
jgi:hypothetical protein